MKRWLFSPVFDDEYRTFAARVLHYTLIILIAFVLTFIPFASSTTQLVFLPASILLFGLCYVLLHLRRLNTANTLFITGLWMIFAIASLSINGIRNASFGSFVVVIIFTAIFFSSRIVLIVAASTIIWGVILVIGELQGVLPLRTTELYIIDRLFQQSASFIVAGILLSAAVKTIHETHSRLRTHEKLLMERNEALEIEIGERRRVEDSLRRSEERYRLLFNNMSAMCGVYDSSGKVILFNNAAAALCDSTPDELIGKTVYDLFAPPDAHRAHKQHLRVLESGHDERAEGYVVMPNGKHLYYLRHVIPFPHTEPTDNPQVIVITTDLTEQKRAEQQSRALAIAEEKNAFLTDFLSTVSHDLKTPLTVMNTNLYLIERAPTPEYREEKFGQMREQIKRLDKYIQDMLTISRLEYLPALKREVLDINAIVRTIAENLRSRVEKKSIALVLTLADDLPSLNGDPEEITRALTNLIENAINYTLEGRVEIRSTRNDAQILVEVVDSGIGISPENRARIFERFYRTDEARRVEITGTGLGLAIVKKIIEMHDGKIELESVHGEGSIFRVYLPMPA